MGHNMSETALLLAMHGRPEDTPQPTPRGTDMANPETTTPSVEGDRLEEIARLVDPDAFKPVAADLVGLRREQETRRDVAFERARQIDALPCKGGEAILWTLYNPDTAAYHQATFRTKADAEIKAHQRSDNYTKLEARPLFATPTTEPDTGKGLREAVSQKLQDAIEKIRVHREGWDQPGAGQPFSPYVPSAPTITELSAIMSDALAALSDTPRGREISEAETHRADAVAPAQGTCSMCFGKLKPEDEDGGRECESCGALWVEGT